MAAAKICLNNDEIYYNLAEMEWKTGVGGSIDFLDVPHAENSEIIPDKTAETAAEA